MDSTESFIAEIGIASFNFAPKEWALCNGQLLPINQNQALFSLLGTMYGGDGRTTFGLPNLRGQVPLHFGNGFTQGQTGGQENHTISLQEMPAHSHFAIGSSNNGDGPVPLNHMLANSASLPYAPAGNLVSLNAATVAATGGSQPHTNVQPYLVLNFCICLQGVFPSQS